MQLNGFNAIPKKYLIAGGWEVITEAFINANQFKMNQTIAKQNFRLDHFMNKTKIGNMYFLVSI